MRTSLAATAFATALVLSLAGCTVPAQVRPSPPPTAPTAAAETAPPEDVDPAPIAGYDELGWQSFNSLPQQDRLQYVRYRLENGREQHAQVMADDRPLFSEPGASSNPQQIVDQFVYVLDEANYQLRIDAQSGQQLHDAGEGIKYLSGAFLRVDGADVSPIFAGEVEAHLSNATGPPYSNNTRLTATAYAAKTVELDGRLVDYQDIEFTNELGNALAGRWVLVPFTALDGTPRSAWLLDQTFSPDEPLADY